MLVSILQNLFTGSDGSTSTDEDNVRGEEVRFTISSLPNRSRCLTLLGVPYNVESKFCSLFCVSLPDDVLFRQLT